MFPGRPGGERKMTQPQLVMRNTVALACARVAEKAAGVCLSFFIARYLGASALGIYSAAIVFLGLTTLAAEMGAPNFLIREIARNGSQTGRLVVHFGVISLVVSWGVMAVSFLIVPHLGYSAELAAGFQAMIVAASPAVLRVIQEAVFVAHQKAEFIPYITLAGGLLNVCASALLLRAGHGVVSLVVVYAGVQYVITLCYAVVLHRYTAPLRWNFSLSFALHLLKEVKAFVGSSILGGVLARPEILILSLFRNDAQIGFYSAAVRLVDLWSVISQTYTKNVFPVLSRTQIADREKGRVILSQSVKYLLAISLPLMSGSFVAAGPVVRLLYGPDFEPSVPLVRIMAWCIPMAFLYELLWRLLAARDEQHLMLRAQAIMAVVRVVGGYLLIAGLASLGAAIVVAVTLAMHDLLLVYYARRDGTELGIWRQGWRLSLAALGAGGFAALLLNRSNLWVALLAAAPLYAVLVVLLKGLTPDDFALLCRARHAGTAN